MRCVIIRVVHVMCNFERCNLTANKQTNGASYGQPDHAINGARTRHARCMMMPFDLVNVGLGAGGR